MKLDLDLIREILIFLEKTTNGRVNFDPNEICDEISAVGNWDVLVVEYHLRQLAEGGYIFTTSGYNLGVIVDLTWKGHEFLADIKPKSTWSRIKDLVLPASSASIDAIKDVACALTIEKLKRNLGLLP